jgi:hypothetical protein
MSEESKKAEEIEQEVKPAELSEQDLDEVAGGVSGNDGGCIPPPKGWPKPPVGVPPAGAF